MMKPRKVVVDVLPEDIRNGERSHHRMCPVATAASRVFPGRDVYVDGMMLVVVESRFGRNVHRLPRKAEEWVRRFDEKGKGAVEPIRFRLSVPCETEEP